MYETALHFLRQVLPSTGRYIAALQRQGMYHTYHETVEALAHYLTKQDGQGKTVYFALGGFGAEDKRTATNVHSLRAFWLDLDCGEGKPYATTDAALDAVDAFVDSGFPDYSLVVFSGRGLHVYWTLTKDAPKDQWQPTADAFQRAWQAAGLQADPISADAARVLRSPGTHHRKAAPTLVELVEETGVVHDLGDFYTACMERAPAPAAVAPAPASDLACNDDLFGGLPNRKAYILPIARRCQQVRLIAQDRGASCAEPLWYAAVQLARHLENGPAVAHHLSSGHPGYDPAAVDAKLAQLESKDIGPTTCAQFRKLNPRACEGCTLKITSPIQLGEKEPERSEPVVVVPQPVVVHEDETVFETVEYRPQVEWPYGFSYNEQVGVVYQYEDDKGVTRFKSVFPGLIFPTRVFQQDGVMHYEIFAYRRSTGRTYLFSAEAAAFGDYKTARSLLMNKVNIVADNAVPLRSLINDMAVALQEKLAEDVSAKQLGWQMATPETRKHFVYGTSRFTPEGVKRGISVAPQIQAMAEQCRPAGTLEGAMAGAALFAGPNATMHLAVYLTGLAGVFAQFTGAQNFAALSLVSRQGGEGKTTNCDAAMSHWFNPAMTRSSPRDTDNAMFNLMSTRGTLPVFIDEVTNTRPERAVELIYTASQGREKARMEQSGLKQREPLAPWKCPVLATSNMSIKQLVRANRSDAAALDARVVELNYHRLDLEPQQRDLINRVFYENYGWTGPLIAQRVVQRFDDWQRAADHIRAQLVKVAGWDGADRFWLNWAVGVWLAGQAMNSAGLAKYDLVSLFRFLCDTIMRQRVEKLADVQSSNDVLGDFLAEHSGQIIVGRRADGNEGTARLVTVADTPRSQAIVGRSQLDESALYIATASLRRFCNDRGVDFRSLLQEAAAEGLLLRDAPERYALGRGTALATSPTRVVTFNLRHAALRQHAADAETVLKTSPGLRVHYADA